MARSAVSKTSLLKVEGLEVLIGKIEKIIANTQGGEAGKKLKRVYFDAAALHSNQVRANIQGLDATARTKEVLTAMVVTNEGPESKPNAISKMSQAAGIRKLGKGVRVPNPYWFEFGTVPRSTGTGANRGMMKPKPFFRPALQQSRARVIDKLKSGFEKVILP